MEHNTAPTPNTPPPPPPPLQFDQVEYADTSELFNRGKKTRCTACKEWIEDSYYEANGQVLCPACKADVQSAVMGGSKTFRMTKAFLFGAVAAIVTSLLYYLLRKITDAEFAIATIAMGWLIGLAVHKGANGRGGWFYQATAVALTYLAISFSYVPMMFEQLSDEEEIAAVGETADSNSEFATREMDAAGPAGEVNGEMETATPPDSSIATEGETVDTDIAANDSESEGGLSTAALVLTLGGFVLSLPILMCKASPIMFLIYGFGLWQAGKMNRRAAISVSGPYYTSNKGELIK